MYTFGIFSILSFIVAIAYFTIGVFGFVREPRRLPNILFAIAGTALGAWGVGEAMERAATTPEIAYFWAAYVVTVAAVIHPAVLLHFWLVFSKKIEKLPQFLIELMYAPAVVLPVFMITHPEWFVVGVRQEPWGYTTVGNNWYVLVSVYVALYVTTVTVLAFQTAWESSGDMRRNSFYIASSITLTLVLGAVTQLIAPLLHIQVPELTIISTLVFVFTVGYAMNRRHLLAIDSRVITQNIIDTIEDVVIATSTDMKIEFANGAIQRRFGYDPSVLIDQPVSDLFSDELLRSSFSDLQKKLPLTDYQTQVRGKSGTKRTVLLSSSLLKEGTDVLGVNFVIRDVTELNQAVEELELKRAELENSQGDLKMKVDELEKLNTLFVDRELRMSELKRQITELEAKKGTA